MFTPKTGKPVSIGDDLKAAATDALKKGASLLGVGLHLYNGTGRTARYGAQRDCCRVESFVSRYLSSLGSTNEYCALL